MFQIAKISGPKVMKRFVLASDIWESDPKIDVFRQFLDSITQTFGRHVCHRKIFCQINTGGMGHFQFIKNDVLQIFSLIYW